MKLILSGIAVSIILLLTSCGNLVNDELSENEPVLYPEADNFGTVIGGDFSVSGKVRILSAGNGGYFISGTKIGEGGRDKIWLEYIDNKANRMWSAALGNLNTNDRLIRIEVLDSENILIFADRYYTVPDSGVIPEADVIMIKVNARDGIVWQRCIGNGKKNIIYDTVLTGDGGFLATGITVTKETATDPSFYTPYVIRFSSNGNIIWKKDYNIYYNINSNKLFEIIRPSEITDIGSGQYLVSGVALNPNNNKLGAFYSIIDGRLEGTSDDGVPYGGGILLLSAYVKSSDSTISVLGNIYNDVSIVSVIGLSEAGNPPEYNIIRFDRETLKIKSKKTYQFSNFNLYGMVIRCSADDFILAGMINPSIGRGYYSIRFDMTGILLELQTKYYDASGFDFINIEFTENNENNGLALVSRLNNPEPAKDLFIDRSISSYVSPALKAVSAAAVVDDSLEEEYNDAVTAESGVENLGDPGLVFSRY
jgi:hypothetical protein